MRQTCSQVSKSPSRTLSSWHEESGSGRATRGRSEGPLRRRRARRRNIAVGLYTGFYSMIFGFAHPLLKPQVLEQSRPILNCVFALTALTKISLFCIMDAGIFSSPFEGEFAALASGGGLLGGGGPESLRSVQSLSIARHCVSSSPPPTRPSVLHNASTPMGPKQDVNMLRGSDIQKVQQLPTAQESAANSSGSRSAASADSTAWLFANA